MLKCATFVTASNIFFFNLCWSVPCLWLLASCHWSFYADVCHISDSSLLCNRVPHFWSLTIIIPSIFSMSTGCHVTPPGAELLQDVWDDDWGPWDAGQAVRVPELVGHHHAHHRCHDHGARGQRGSGSAASRRSRSGLSPVHLWLWGFCVNFENLLDCFLANDASFCVFFGGSQCKPAWNSATEKDNGNRTLSTPSLEAGQFLTPYGANAAKMWPKMLITVHVLIKS